MKKGLKQKISLLLSMAMVITMSMPVSARENRSVFDDTPITEEPSSDLTVIEEEPAPDNLQASETVSIETERDVVGSDAEEEIITGLGDSTTPVWAASNLTITNLKTSESATSEDYTLDNGTITIKKTDNSAGIEVTLVSSPGNVALNLTWEDITNNTVPVTLTANSDFSGVGTINITASAQNDTTHSKTT